MITMLLAAMLGAQAVPAPSAEAEALGAELARNGVLATLLPTLAMKETEDLIGQHPELTPADKDLLRKQGKAQAEAVIARVAGAIGHQYALSMSIDDMKAVIAFNASGPARKWRGAEPSAIIAATRALDGFDFKAAVAQDFCKATGKLCPGPAKK